MMADDGVARGGGAEEPDPFADLTLDEDFVSGASVSEPSAEDRRLRIERLRAEHDRLAERADIARRTARRSEKRERRRNRLVVAAVMSGLAFLGVWSYTHRDSDQAAGVIDLAGPGVGGTEVQLAGGQPPAGVEAAAEPLGQPAPLAVTSPVHRYIATQPGSSEPVAYDPCRPIHVVVNNRLAIAGSDALLNEALAAVSRASGLQFVVDGQTEEAPSTARAPYLPLRYPDRWAPVLVSWTDPTEMPDLAGDVAGSGGSSWVTTPDGSVYLSGQIALDGPAMAAIAAEANGYNVARAIIEHELGHLVGLDHVDDDTQLMAPTTTAGILTYQDGDLTGLAELGRGDCFPDL